jgi:hypothetical protein
MPVAYVMFFLQKAFICLPHYITGQNIQRKGKPRDSQQIRISPRGQQPEDYNDENYVPRLPEKPDKLIPGRMMQHAVIGIQNDYHDEIYQDNFQKNTPEKQRIQYPFFLNK